MSVNEEMVGIMDTDALNPGDENLEPNEESLASIEEAEKILATGGRGYESANKMFEAMGL